MLVLHVDDGGLLLHVIVTGWVLILYWPEEPLRTVKAASLGLQVANTANMATQTCWCR